jgi:CheY-like chemotaxis protein
MLSRILSSRRAAVKGAASADEGLRLLASQKFDFLISDISMPEKDGYQFIKELRSGDSPNNRIPAIALTALARTDDRIKAMVAGFDLHIGKPLNPNELLAVLLSLASR